MRDRSERQSQMVSLLKEAENGRQTRDLLRGHGVSTACFYGCKSEYGGIESSDLER